MDSIFDIKKWHNIHIAEIYHPTLQFWAQIFIDLTFLLSIIFYAFTSYVLLTRSTKAMGSFKFAVFCQLSWNMAYQVYLFVVAPILHWPLPIISSNSYFPISPKFVIITFVLSLCVIIGGGISFFIALGNRVMAVFRGPLSVHWLMAIQLGAYSVVMISGLVPFYYMLADTDKTQEYFEADVPAVAELYQNLPLTTGFHSSLANHHMVHWFFGIMLFWGIVGTVLFFGFNAAFLWKIKQAERKIKTETYFLHKMLQKTLITHMLVAGVFAGIPMGLLYVLFVLQLRWASWVSAFVFPLSSLYLLVDCPLLLYFVKPFRVYIRSLKCWRPRSVAHMAPYAVEPSVPQNRRR